MNTAESVNEAQRGNATPPEGMFDQWEQEWGGETGTGYHGGGTASADACDWHEDGDEEKAPEAFTFLLPKDIFEPLAPMDWLCEELRLGGARPFGVVGQSFDAKTLTEQAKMLCLAAGQPIWGRFACRQSTVVHFDYEQGAYATRKRYQRLAYGMGIPPFDLGDRLRLAAMPEVNLTNPRAFDLFAKATDGCDVALVDSLRASVPGVDENDSGIRAFIDILTRVHEANGCTFVVIHHKGKGGRDKDHREQARGSSGIVDALGTVMTMRSDAPDAPKEVTFAKTAAEAEGLAESRFYLQVEDVPDERGNPKAGLRVVYRSAEEVDPPTTAEGRISGLEDRIVSALSNAPCGYSKTALKGVVKGDSNLFAAALETLVHRGVVGEAPRKGRGAGSQYTLASAGVEGSADE